MSFRQTLIIIRIDEGRIAQHLSTKGLYFRVLCFVKCIPLFEERSRRTMTSADISINSTVILGLVKYLSFQSRVVYDN
jgi:hypothetical protein